MVELLRECLTILEKIHSYCRLTLPTLRLDLIFLLQTVSDVVEFRAEKKRSDKWHKILYIVP